MGEGVEQLKVGDRVFGMANNGAFAEETVCNAMVRTWEIDRVKSLMFLTTWSPKTPREKLLT